MNIPIAFPTLKNWSGSPEEIPGREGHRPKHPVSLAIRGGLMLFIRYITSITDLAAIRTHVPLDIAQVLDGINEDAGIRMRRALIHLFLKGIMST